MAGAVSGVPLALAAAAPWTALALAAAASWAALALAAAASWAALSMTVTLVVGAESAPRGLVSPLDMSDQKSATTIRSLSAAYAAGKIDSEVCAADFADAEAPFIYAVTNAGAAIPS